MEVRELTSERREWSGLASRGTYFHTPEWLDAVGCEHFLIAEERAEIVGILPITGGRRVFKEFASLPTPSLYGGALGSKEAQIALVRNAFEIGRKIASCTRLIYPPNTNPEFLFPFMDKEVRRTQILKLEGDYGKIYMGFEKERRYDVRKAPEDAKVEALKGKEINDFYKIYKETMGRLHAHPEPLCFFERVAVLNGCKLFGVKIGGELIGGGLFTFHGGTVTHLIGASKLEKRKEKPNVLLLNYVIEKGCMDGYERLDLGPSGEDKDLFRFKNGWGAEEAEYIVLEKAHTPLRRIQRSAISVGRKIRGII